MLARQRGQILQTAAAMTSAHSLLIGDFNAVPWNEALEQIGRQPGAPQRLSLGPRSTWLSPLPLLGAAIDHAFVSNALVGSVALGPANGSDHFPIIVSLKRIPDPQTGAAG